MIILKLEKLDYEILEFINSTDDFTEINIINCLKSNVDVVNYRLELLAEKKFREVSGFYEAIPNSSYVIKVSPHQQLGNFLKPNEIPPQYILTDLGKKTLQDYQLFRKESEQRYKETLSVAKHSNYISFVAVFISAVALIISIFRN